MAADPDSVQPRRDQSRLTLGLKTPALATDGEPSGGSTMSNKSHPIGATGDQLAAKGRPEIPDQEYPIGWLCDLALKSSEAVDHDADAGTHRAVVGHND